MNTNEYRTALANWKLAYAEQAQQTRELKHQLKAAQLAFSKAPHRIRDVAPERVAAHKGLVRLQHQRIAMKAQARNMLEERQALRDEALAYWCTTHSAAA